MSVMRLGLCLGLALAPLLAAATGGIDVVVRRGADAGHVDRRELALIYQRKQRFWPDGRRVEPANLPATDPVRHAFSLAVLGHTPEELDDYWRDAYFHGELPPHVAASVEAVIRFVVANPGAVGYVPACRADARVTVILHLDDGPPCPAAR